MSKALVCSVKLYKMIVSAGNGKGFDLNEAWKYHKTIKQTLEKARVQEKALKIILKKNANIIYLKNSPTLDEYNLWTCGAELTKVEFDFLKEVLEYINLKEGDSYEE